MQRALRQTGCRQGKDELLQLISDIGAKVATGWALAK